LIGQQADRSIRFSRFCNFAKVLYYDKLRYLLLEWKKDLSKDCITKLGNKFYFWYVWQHLQDFIHYDIITCNLRLFWIQISNYGSHLFYGERFCKSIYNGSSSGSSLFSSSIVIFRGPKILGIQQIFQLLLDRFSIPILLPNRQVLCLRAFQSLDGFS
jgi:hypothetical protein